jgi:hypothetical protein
VLAQFRQSLRIWTFIKPVEIPVLEWWSKEFFLQQCSKIG